MREKDVNAGAFSIPRRRLNKRAKKLRLTSWETSER